MKPDFRVVAQTSIYGNGRGVQGMSSKSSSGKLESRVGFSGWLDDQDFRLVQKVFSGEVTVGGLIW